MSEEATRSNSDGTLRLSAGKTVGPGRFTLIKELGRGGMGVVWLAQDTSLGEQVALKFLPPEVCHDPVALNDLRRETVRSHRLTHPNIIRIHDFQQQPDGVAFISMEYVDGQTLSGWRLQQPKQVFAWEQLAPLVKQLCTALDYAHGEGVIHRDLKPANVMLDSRGRVKLADFGIAAVVNDSMSRVSVRSSTGGTLAYMSPQQLRGQRPTVADDVYALGATLYELLTGRPPFYMGDITHQVLNEPPTPLSERALDLGVDNPVPPEVAAVIMACLAKDPAQRPASAEAVAAWVGLAVPTANPVALPAADAEVQEPEDLPPQREEEEPAPVAAGESWLKRPWVWAVGGVAACLVLGGLGWMFLGKKSASVDTGGAIANLSGSSSGTDNRVSLPSEMQKGLAINNSFDASRPATKPTAVLPITTQSSTRSEFSMPPLPLVAGMTWQANLDIAQDEARRTGRMMVLGSGLDGCQACERTRQQVLSRPAFAEYARARLVLANVPRVEHRAIATRNHSSEACSLLVFDGAGQRSTEVRCWPNTPTDLTQRLDQFAAGDGGRAHGK